jgi:hypothetical protein
MLLYKKPQDNSTCKENRLTLTVSFRGFSPYAFFAPNAFMAGAAHSGRNACLLTLLPEAKKEQKRKMRN